MCVCLCVWGGGISRRPAAEWYPRGRGGNTSGRAAPLCPGGRVTPAPEFQGYRGTLLFGQQDPGGPSFAPVTVAIERPELWPLAALPFSEARRPSSIASKSLD